MRNLLRARVPLLLLLAGVAGCPSIGTEPPPAGSSGGEGSGGDSFTRIDAVRPAGPDPAELAREAVAGTAVDANHNLGSRMQVRTIRMPRPPRGSNARFNFGQGRRGWITSLPSSTLLTSAAYSDGKVFLGGGFASHRFYAFDAFTGELSWSVAAPDGGPTAAIVHDDKVIFNTESCTIFVADVNSGELLWSRWLGDPLMSQPAAAGQLVFSAYPSQGGHRMGAFRLSDGTPVWDTPIAADVIQAPQVVGDALYFATMDGTAYRLDTETGRVRWHRDVGASSAVWVDRNNLLLARRTGRGEESQEQMVVLGTERGRVQHEGEHHAAPYFSGQSRDRVLGAGQAGAWGNVVSGDHLGLRNVASGWAFQGSTPAVADGRAYFAISGEVVARDMETARPVWRRRYGAAEGAQALSPPAVVGSLLVFGTVDGQVFATDIDTGMTVWAYEIGEPVVFQPVVAQGWVYVSTARGNVIGLELGDSQLDGWHMWGGNAQHAGLVETAGRVDPEYLASLERPERGTLRALGLSSDTQGDADDDSAAEESAEIEPRALPLRGTQMRARVSGRVAEVHLTQTFQNDGPEGIEAVYLFPLPADAAVDQMEMRIGERVIRGVIRERGQARATYEQARSEGRRAALLEQQRPNLFAQRVSNIQPGESVEVQLRYVQALPMEDGEYEMVFPMIAPRRFRTAGSTPSTGDNAVTANAGSALEQPPLDIELSLDAGMPISSIDVPSHTRQVRVVRPSRERAQVHLRATGEARARDFVLRYRLGGATPNASLLAHRNDEGGYFTLLLQPPVTPGESAIVSRDVTFVVDTSSSMNGAPLTHAQEVIRRTIRSLRPGDRINVLGFSDEVRAMASRPITREEGALERATTFIDSLRATGATEMVPAIERALAQRTRPDGLSLVVLVSDGFIGDEPAVLRSIAEHVGEHRFYTFGIGTAVNRFLIERSAEIGRGRALVTAANESPAEASERFLAWIDRPVFTDVEVDFGGLDVSDVYPRHLPDLFAAHPLELRGRFGRGGRATVRVRGNIGARRYERTIQVELPSTPSEDGSHASQASLWARAAVHDRMNRLIFADDPALIQEVTEIGIAHHLVTQWTSFVAVERRREPTEDSADTTEAAQSRPTVSPARALPGDPEIRIPAPADARTVTVVLPFGESLNATYEAELSMWTARFLIPRDAEEGTYPIDILVTHADGRFENLRVWYTVDATGAQVRVEVEGDVRPGNIVTLRAEQIITEADLAQVGRRPGQLSEERVVLLSDARRVEVRSPDGEVINLRPAGPGSWGGTYRVPADARGILRLSVITVDMAANVSRQSLDLTVQQ